MQSAVDARSRPGDCCLYIWPVGQAVKTPPFHGGNTSSILVRVTKKTATSYDVAVFLLLFSTRIELRGGCGVKKTVWYTVFSQQEPCAPSEARQYARRSRSRRRNRTGHQKSSDLIGRNFFFLYRTFLRRGTPPKRQKISTAGRENFSVTPTEVRGICHSAFR